MPSNNLGNMKVKLKHLLQWKLERNIDNIDYTEIGKYLSIDNRLAEQLLAECYEEGYLFLNVETVCNNCNTYFTVKNEQDNNIFTCSACGYEQSAIEYNKGLRYYYIINPNAFIKYNDKNQVVVPFKRIDKFEKKGLEEMERKINVFVSYSHIDENYKDNLYKFLIMLKRSERIQAWNDRELLGGDYFGKEIDKKLESADLVLLLVSQDFIASDYCYTIEMKKALERYEQGKNRVVAIILRDCDWKSTPLKDIICLPKDGLPITKWSDKDSAFMDVADNIKKIVSNMLV